MQRARSALFLPFALCGDDHTDSGDARIIGGDILSVDWIGRLVDDVRDVGKTSADR